MHLKVHFHALYYIYFSIYTFCQKKNIYIKKKKKNLHMCIFCSNFAADFNMREYALAFAFGE